MIAVRGVHHVALRVGDVVTIAAFYAKVFGLRRAAVHRDAKGIRSLWLRAGDTLVMLERREASEPAIPSGSREALLFAIDAIDRRAFERRLARAGATLDGETDFTVYARDPEGRRIGVSHYPTARPETRKPTVLGDGGPRGRR